MSRLQCGICAPTHCWGVADKSDRGASHTQIVWETSLQTILTGMWGVCANTTLWVRHEMHTVRLLTVTHFISWRTTITTTTEQILEDNRIQNRFVNYVLVLLITVLVHTWHVLHTVRCTVHQAIKPPRSKNTSTHLQLF